MEPSPMNLRALKEVREAVAAQKEEHDKPQNRWAAEVTKRMFEGRTGHGGGPCSKRVLRDMEIFEIAKASFEAGQKTPRLARELIELVSNRWDQWVERGISVGPEGVDRNVRSLIIEARAATKGAC